VVALAAGNEGGHRRGKTVLSARDLAAWVEKR